MSALGPASKIRKIKVAVYGIEKYAGATLFDFEAAQYVIHCVPKVSSERLCDFDSVVVMQGVCEDIHESQSVVDDYRWLSADVDEMDRRTKELLQVREKGGFVVFAMIRALHDELDGRWYKDTDLAKRFSNFRELLREDFSAPVPYVTALKSELNKFCEQDGRAYSHFTYVGGNEDVLEFLPLIKTQGNKIVGFSILRWIYYLPTILPKKSEWVAYLQGMVDPVLSIHKKRQIELPGWIKSFPIANEQEIKAKIYDCEQTINNAREALAVLNKKKRILLETGDDLVSTVAEVISDVTGYRVDFDDNKKEDCRIIDHDGHVVALVEVKGLNGNVKMSNVSQAFEHRERTEGYECLPVILVANTFIGTARSAEEKDKPVDDEQIEIAKKHNVLILRTLDLLRMYSAIFSGQCSRPDVVKMFLTESGWRHFNCMEGKMFTGESNV